MLKRFPVMLVVLVGLMFISFAVPALEAQKIAAMKQSNETLWQFLKAMPHSMEAQIFYGLFLSGIFGMISSWLWKWSQGLAEGFSHFTKRYVVGQILWLAGSSVGAIATVGFTTEAGDFFGWLSVLWSGALAGFSGDVKTKDSERLAAIK